MAGPIWNALPAVGGDRPLLLIVDDGWAAAPTWARRIAYARAALASAARSGRLVALAADLARRSRSHGARRRARRREAARAGTGRLRALARSRSCRRSSAFSPPTRAPRSTWIADGLELGGAGAFARALRAAAEGHPVSVVLDRTTPVALAGADNLAGALSRASDARRRRGAPRRRACARSTRRGDRSARRRSISGR